LAGRGPYDLSRSASCFADECDHAVPVCHVAHAQQDEDALQVIALTRPAANSDSVAGFDEFAPERDGVAIIRTAAMPADHAQISVAGLLMMGEQGAARADAVKRGHSLPLLCSRRTSEVHAAQL